MKLVPVVPGSKREAYYVSKYVTKSSDCRREVPWIADVVDAETGELHEGVPVPGRYRTWSTSREWGITMLAVRRAAHELFLTLDATRAELELASVMSDLATSLGGELILPDESPPPPS